jgi:hypothetical protein
MRLLKCFSKVPLGVAVFLETEAKTAAIGLLAFSRKFFCKTNLMSFLMTCRAIFFFSPAVSSSDKAVKARVRFLFCSVPVQAFTMILYRSSFPFRAREKPFLELFSMRRDTFSEKGVLGIW